MYCPSYNKDAYKGLSETYSHDTATRVLSLMQLVNAELSGDVESGYSLNYIDKITKQFISVPVVDIINDVMPIQTIVANFTPEEELASVELITNAINLASLYTFKDKEGVDKSQLELTNKDLVDNPSYSTKNRIILQLQKNIQNTENFTQEQLE